LYLFVIICSGGSLFLRLRRRRRRRTALSISIINHYFLAKPTTTATTVISIHENSSPFSPPSIPNQIQIFNMTIILGRQQAAP